MFPVFFFSLNKYLQTNLLRFGNSLWNSQVFKDTVRSNLFNCEGQVDDETLLSVEPRDPSRIFPKINHSGSAARIALEQNKFSQKLPLTGIKPWTL